MAMMAYSTTPADNASNLLNAKNQMSYISS